MANSDSPSQKAARGEMKSVLETEKNYAAMILDRSSPAAIETGKKAIHERRMGLGYGDESDKQKKAYLTTLAGVASFTKDGDLKLVVKEGVRNDVRDILAGKPLTVTKDYSRDGVDHKAGEPRNPSAKAFLIVNAMAALRNTKTGATGLDALPTESGVKTIYFEPKKLAAVINKVKEPEIMLAALKETLAGDRKEQASLQVYKQVQARKDKEQGQGR